MINIRSVSDLRNKFSEIETIVNNGEPVYLSEYAQLTENIEMKLDEADHQTSTTTTRLSHDDIFNSARATLHGKK